MSDFTLRYSKEAIEISIDEKNSLQTGLTAPISLGALFIPEYSLLSVHCQQGQGPGKLEFSY